MNPESSARTARISRRQMLYALSIGGAGTAFDWHVPAYAAQAASAAGTPPFAALNRFPRMVQEFFVARENALHQQRLERLAALKTKADAEAYVRTVRGKIRESFGPFPEKTPLNARVTKVVERDAYKIENVIFESRPGFLVTANLYIPKGRRFPLPGVVGSCGHSANGKAIDTYQSFCQGLARLGYVVPDLRPDRPGRAHAVRRCELEADTRDRHRRAQLRGQPAGPGGRTLLHVARVGRHPRARLSAHPRGGRHAPPRHHRQLRRRHDDHVAVRPGRPVDDGRAELLRHRTAPQHGERAARRHGADARRARSRSASITRTSSRRWRRSRSSSWQRRRTTSTRAGTKPRTSG